MLDKLMNQANELGARFGLTPDQVQAILAAIQSKIGNGSDQMTAIQQVAREQGLPVDKIQELLGQGGGGDLVGKLGGLAGGLFGKG
ncbi:MAG TPA: hypothetical protein VFQ69_01400 [Rhizomicrobium sp.]|jgi:pantoate kinase|nr:hypothetical protein [Rhizomicrobium sp.]